MNYGANTCQLIFFATSREPFLEILSKKNGAERPIPPR